LKEDQLIKYCKKGDPKAFELLVHKYSPLLAAICRRYVTDSAGAKDALQECFINIFKGIKNYESSGNFTSWLKRIAVTSSLKELRKKKKNVVSLASISEENIELTQEEPIAIEKLNITEVMQVINKLPDHYRIAFNLYVIEGYNHREISAIENIDETTSRARVSRARKKVKELLLKNQEYYGFTSARRMD